ncbi:SDR family NAD(P)-dependent oxidoreductase [Microbacterium sp. NPDC079995]|uniref:SDR family NAD(P)-dependent oxidoreductase n=1 Tax=unclassified Microbacterium TaxID=2609290 RepID=UPI00344D80E6
MSRRRNLQDATVVVTGASSGVGRGTAMALAARGARVVLAARRADALEHLARELRARGGRALVVPTDVSDAAAVAALARQALEWHGGIDVWINNAAVTAVGRFWDVPLSDHHRVVEVTLGGALNGSHAALTAFIGQGHGTLVNVGSLEAAVPLAYHSSYAASKAGLETLTRVLHQEVRLTAHADRIHLASVLPWALDTPLWRHVANRLGRTPRMAAMEDPARAVAAVLRACTRPRLTRPVGVKATLGALSARALPRLTDHLAASLSEVERRRGHRRPLTAGSLHTPRADEPDMRGDMRAVMRAEDHTPSLTTEELP